ncbi:hypothetical protein ACFWM5_00405 [Streptomyces bobili]|uniref:hypothetical protein n=1 Tax=Streptomyces bobili TaxID=67280 RepID=UPI0036682F35
MAAIVVKRLVEEVEVSCRELGNRLYLPVERIVIDHSSRLRRYPSGLTSGLDSPRSAQLDRQECRDRKKSTRSHRRNHLSKANHPETPQSHVGDICTE